jgi:hypothetical protein
MNRRILYIDYKAYVINLTIFKSNKACLLLQVSHLCCYFAAQMSNCTVLAH